MTKEDYFKYYIQGLDHYLIPKDVFNELFNEMVNWREEAIKYKETKQKEFINYLEDEIKRINPKELDIGELNLRLNDIKFTQYLIYKEILSKYKKIIRSD